ncbi:MAG TPA: putative sulfate/molybdate transporter [Solirubrobacteraceae bacterium]|nr:putative sulfate/molybdate transporter [Solirubrobacteraceae bacterium]
MTAAAAAATPVSTPPRLRLDRRELAGAVGDVGVLVPIATVLVVANGLSATAVLLPAGLLYLGVAAAYRLPVAVQPLKAFGAIAIAQGLGSDAIAAGALLMGVVFLVLGRAGLIDLAARAFPVPVVRGIQLTVGVLFLEIAWDLVREPPAAFADASADPALLTALALTALGAAMALRRRSVSLALVAGGLLIAVVRAAEDLTLGPSPLVLPTLDAATFWTAFTVLVVPQLPLTFANSCVATSDVARTYFGAAAERVRPGRLAQSLGLANLVSGAIAGMPVCHGAGGMTAHRAFGARTAGAPAAIGAVLVAGALVLGAGMAALLAAFPLAVLAAMLAAAGLLHIGLLGDLRGRRAWAIGLAVGAVGVLVGLAPALVVGLVAWWVPARIASRRDAPVSSSQG